MLLHLVDASSSEKLVKVEEFVVGKRFDRGSCGGDSMLIAAKPFKSLAFPQNNFRAGFNHNHKRMDRLGTP